MVYTCAHVSMLPAGWTSKCKMKKITNEEPLMMKWGLYDTIQASGRTAYVRA